MCRLFSHLWTLGKWTNICPYDVNSFHIFEQSCVRPHSKHQAILFSDQLWSWSNVKLQFSITFAKVVFLFLRPRYLTLYLSTYPSESVSCSLVQLIWWTITNVQLYPFPSNATIIRTKMMICHIKLSPIIWTVEHQLLLQSIKQGQAPFFTSASRFAISLF